MTNFRGFRSLKIDFNDRMNVFVGVNGAGKSSVLDCIAIMLSRLISKFNSPKGGYREFAESDITNGEQGTVNEIEIEAEGIWTKWKIPKSRKILGKRDSLSYVNMGDLEEKIRKNLIENEHYNLPLCVYYGVNRNINSVSVGIRKNHDFSQLSAYDQALSGNHSDFNLFFEWFRDREDYENEKVRENRSYHDLQLETVRNAIERFTGFTDLKVKRETPRLELKKGNEYFDVQQLSEGEKCFLALVGDIARRLAIANPGLEFPLEGEGVILIDEIDLHLHPSWQRTIISRLCDVFPKCQFIVSTHSPVVISHVKPASLYLMYKEDSIVKVTNPDESFGKNSDRILEDIMDVSARPAEVEKELNQLFENIERKNLREARAGFLV